MSQAPPNPDNTELGEIYDKFLSQVYVDSTENGYVKAVVKVEVTNEFLRQINALISKARIDELEGWRNKT